MSQMHWIKLNIPNKPTYINISLLAQIEFNVTRGELWLYFCGSSEPVRISNGSKSVLDQILTEIDNTSGSNFRNIIEVNSKND